MNSGEWIDNVYYRYVNQMRWTFDNVRWIEMRLSGKGIVIGTGTSALPIETYTFTYANKTGSNQILGNFKETSYFIQEDLNSQDGTPFLASNLVQFNFLPWSVFVLEPGGEPDEGGGLQDWGQGAGTTATDPGTFDATSDVLEDADPTSFKAAQSYNEYYVLNLAQVYDLKQKIWSIWTNLPGLARASEAIIAMNFFPFDLSAISFNTNSNVVNLGNSFLELVTSVRMLNANYCNAFSFGTFKLEPYFKGFQDYEPYTNISIYLPFVGIQRLSAQYVQDKTLEVVYYVNFTDGSAIACIYCDDVLYTKFNCKLAQTVPLSQVTNDVVQSVVNTAISSAGVAVANPAAGAASFALGTLSSVVSNRPHISAAQGGGGECETSLPLEVFLIIERPHCAIAQTYNSEVGRPSYINKKLSNCKGFTKMLEPRCTATCTSSENDRINQLLKSGVIINE